MLELLGFIALVAIIFGVSMTAAVGIIIKAVLWCVGICLAIYVVGKIKKETIIVIAVIIAGLGVYLLATLDNYQESRNEPCFSMSRISFDLYGDCLEKASQSVDSRMKTSIWAIVVSAVLFVASWLKNGENSLNKGGVSGGMNPNAIIHRMRLREDFFNYIKNGTKRIELRLYDEKRRKIQVGDEIVFVKNKEDDESLRVRVIELILYPSFWELAAEYDIKELADESITKGELLEALDKFYPEEEQKEFGVVGIRFELV